MQVHILCKHTKNTPNECIFEPKPLTYTPNGCIIYIEVKEKPKKLENKIADLSGYGE